MKKNGVKNVVKNYKNGEKIRAGLKDIGVKIVGLEKQEID